VPTNVYVPEGEVLEGNDVFLVSRVVRADGVYLSESDLDLSESATVVSINVYDLDDRSVSQEAFYTLAIAGSAVNAHTLFVLSDTASALVTDGYWDGLDSTGYNVRYRLQSSLAALEGGKRYRVEFKVTTDTNFGNVIWSHIINVRSHSVV